MNFKNTLPCLLICSCSLVNAQFGNVQYIDNDSDSGNTTSIAVSDIDMDSYNDVIAVKAYNADNITLYFNNGNNTFSQQVIAPVNDPAFVNAQDIDQDGFDDLLVMTQTNGELMLLMNNGGTFSGSTPLDTETSFGKGVKVADFDNDGDQDLVAIWQHAINFYANDGNENFTKTPILTTGTSPNLLECWTIEKVDINTDGSMDIITGETIGTVVYLNDGNANFTPHTITTVNHTTITSIVLGKFNNDNLMDMAFQGDTGAVSLYLNQDNSGISFTFDNNLFSAASNSIKRMISIDANNDGLLDIYTAFLGDPRVLIQGNNLDFSQEMVLENDPNLFVNLVAMADLDDQQDLEFIWAAPANTIAYQKSTALSVTQNTANPLKLFPNPVENIFYIDGIDPNTDVKIYSITGKLLMNTKVQSNHPIDISGLSTGIYFVEINSPSSTEVFKIQKQ